MGFEGPRDDGRQVHGPPAGIGLGRGDDAVASPQLDGLDLYSDDGRHQVDITATERKQLTQP